MKNNIMLRKIILPVVLLIFTQQELYGMDEEVKQEGKNTNKHIEEECDFWKGVNDYMNQKELSYLWVFLDNVPFQYGNSKVWKHGEAYYGLSNGIGFFPSVLNFGWLKIGICDAHINVINTIIKYMKIYTQIKYDYYYWLKRKQLESYHKKPLCLNILKWWLFYTLVTDIHLFSFKFFNCVKIKIISIGAVVTSMINGDLLADVDGYWFFPFDLSYGKLKVPAKYFILSPRIEINIPEIIDYFKGK